MEIKDLIKTWYFDLISSGLGVALIYWSFEIKADNSFWWIAFFSGIVFNIPTFYFQLGIFFKELFGTS